MAIFLEKTAIFSKFLAIFLEKMAIFYSCSILMVLLLATFGAITRYFRYLQEIVMDK